MMGATHHVNYHPTVLDAGLWPLFRAHVLTNYTKIHQINTKDYTKYATQDS